MFLRGRLLHRQLGVVLGIVLILPTVVCDRCNDPVRRYSARERPFGIGPVLFRLGPFRRSVLGSGCLLGSGTTGPGGPVSEADFRKLLRMVSVGGHPLCADK